MSSLGNRRETDVFKLMMNGFSVELLHDRTDLFNVVFHGPKESPYESGVWKINVQLPSDYPYMPPKIAFVNRIFHPNIDELSGSICLDVINQSWSPMSDLVNVFETFLSQLLLYPNPAHGLNQDAIFLLMGDKDKYEQKVKECCVLYAKAEDIIGSRPGVQSSDEDVNGGEDTSSDDEAAEPEDEINEYLLKS